MRNSFTLTNVTKDRPVAIRILPMGLTEIGHVNNHTLDQNTLGVIEPALSLAPTYHGAGANTIGYGLYQKNTEGKYHLHSVIPDWYNAVDVAEKFALPIEPDPWVNGAFDDYPQVRIIRTMGVGDITAFTVKYYPSAVCDVENHGTHTSEIVAVNSALILAMEMGCHIAPPKAPRVYPVPSAVEVSV